MVGWRSPFFRRQRTARAIPACRTRAQKAPLSLSSLFGVFLEVDKLPADPPGKIDHHTVTYRHQHTYVIPFHPDTSNYSSNQQNSKPEHPRQLSAPARTRRVVTERRKKNKPFMPRLLVRQNLQQPLLERRRVPTNLLVLATGRKTSVKKNRVASRIILCKPITNS